MKTPSYAAIIWVQKIAFWNLGCNELIRPLIPIWSKVKGILGVHLTGGFQRWILSAGTKVLQTDGFLMQGVLKIKLLKNQDS
jgi:hypothetical protein